MMPPDPTDPPLADALRRDLTRNGPLVVAQPMHRAAALSAHSTVASN